MSKTKIWYTADGRDLQVRQMEPQHIVHSILLIQSRARRGKVNTDGSLWRAAYVPALLRELHRRQNLAR